MKKNTLLFLISLLSSCQLFSMVEDQSPVIGIMAYDPIIKKMYAVSSPSRTVPEISEEIDVQFQHPTNGETWTRKLSVVAIIRKSNPCVYPPLHHYINQH